MSPPVIWINQAPDIFWAIISEFVGGVPKFTETGFNSKILLLIDLSLSW
jgi:hypothetical protein